MLFALAVMPLLAVAADAGPSGGVSFDAPATVASALVDARTALDVAGRCDETSAQLGIEPAYEQVESRYYAVLRLAEGIWGNAVLGDADQSEPASGPVACDRANILQKTQEAELALDDVERAFAEATLAMMGGAWAGPLRLCRDTVLLAEPGLEAFAGQPTVLVTLQPGSAAVLGSITGRSIDGPLAIRLDGEIIAEPNVLEKIDGGRFQVIGPELPALERLGEAVSRPC